jgi:HPt (histidine-containing phosphotransfer) domain-containing protein
MIDLGLADPVAAPSLSPVAGPIDLAHLSRMTLGERALEREVLHLFDRQAEMLLARMRDAVPSAAAAYAHTLKGSARGIGAWEVARSACDVEMAAQGRDREAQAQALAQLTAAVGAARRAIADLLRAN